MKLFLIMMLFSILGCKELNLRQNTSDEIKNTKKELCFGRIFLQDSILGVIRNHASKKISISEAILDYTKKLQSLDYKNCPENFKSAFNNHIEAWKKVTKISDNYPFLRGELHNLFAQLEKSEDSTEFKYLLKEVWDSWTIVQENTR